MTDKLRKLVDDLENWGAEPKLVLEETFMNDHSFFLQCLKKFANEQFLDKLRVSLAQNETESAIFAVHTMKGNADYLGLFPVMDAAMKILMDLRAGDLACASAGLPELEQAFAAYQTILASCSE